MHVFDKTVQQAHLWIKEMMAELRTDDPQKALHALRAGLHALRDRLPVDEVAQLSAQLPQLIRGLFFENWVPSGKPLRIRHAPEFLSLVRENYTPRHDAAAAEIVAAMFRLLSRHVSVGELSDVMMSLPEELAAMADGGRSKEHRADEAHGG